MLDTPLRLYNHRKAPDQSPERERAGWQALGPPSKPGTGTARLAALTFGTPYAGFRMDAGRELTIMRGRMIVIIDNYDSFTYNLVQRLGEIGLASPALRHEIVVHRNDAVTVEQIAGAEPTHLIVSPGPCTPTEGGISNDAIRALYTKIPVLGVCLGHQCIGHVFGATVTRADSIMHGKTSEIHHDGLRIYAGVSNPFIATRYHSLIVVRDTIGDEFDVSAWTDDGVVMGIRHKTAPLEGVQFHPESFLTTEGARLLENFLRQ